MMALLSSRIRRGAGRRMGYRAGGPAPAATWLAALLISAGPMQAAAPAQQPPAAAAATPQATFQRYCVTCHNQNPKDRGNVPIAFDTLDLSKVDADAAVWE